MGRNDEAWPVFWCSLLSPLRLGEIPEGKRERYFQQLSRQERLLPNGKRGRVSVGTLRRKWRQLRDQGVQRLFRQPRSDRGKPRSRDAALLRRAVELKKEQPYRSDKIINRILRREFGRRVPRSTLYRHLRREGATRLKLGVSKHKVRCRWTRDHSNALWVGDFEHGPRVIHQGQAAQTHLSAWIDCHSRYVVEARYYVRENLDILIDSLLRAWGHQGASRELYVDNAKIYHATALALACTELNIKLLHRPPRDPPAGGLIERFFQTLQTQLEREIRASQILALDELNRLLAAWLQVAYHAETHSEIKQTPHERYYQEPHVVRNVDLGAVLTFFHRRERRTVNHGFSDVRFDSLFFAVDPSLRGDEILVEHDPFSAQDEVQLYSLAGIYLGRGRRHQRESKSPPLPTGVESHIPIEPHYLDVLRAEHQASHEQQRASGLDFYSARQRNQWPLAGFANKLARLLGRKGGVSAVSAQEMEILAAFHARHEHLTEALLKQALIQAESRSIPEILFHLQSLLHERSP